MLLVTKLLLTYSHMRIILSLCTPKVKLNSQISLWNRSKNLKYLFQSISMVYGIWIHEKNLVHKSPATVPCLFFNPLTPGIKYHSIHRHRLSGTAENDDIVWLKDYCSGLYGPMPVFLPYRESGTPPAPPPTCTIVYPVNQIKSRFL